MNFIEEAVCFAAAGERLVGVLAIPERAVGVGVVVIVGGPQYRVGSHRQFVLLARHLARQGIAVMRFDYRGMGDGGGAAVGFEHCSDDVGAAIAAMRARCPQVGRVVLWGLCDGASAALLFLEHPAAASVAGLCLLNPWVRSETSLARAQVKHYYGQRLLERSFWAKLLSGKVDLAGAARELARKLRQAARGGAEQAATAPFQSRMASALRAFEGQVLLLLSGRDLTAREFVEYVAADSAWAGLLGATRVTRHEVAEADHTFSAAPLRAEVEDRTLRWLVDTVGAR